MRRGSRGDSRIFVTWALSVAACAGPPRETPRERAAVRSEPPRRRSELVVAARNWPPVSARFVSRGHGDGSYSIDIRVTPESLDGFRTLVLGRTVPSGTAAVAFHFSVRSSAAESVFAMTKRADGKWDFLVTDARGGVLSEGMLPLCTRCHADAPADFMFVPVEVAAPIVSGPTDAGR